MIKTDSIMRLALLVHLYDSTQLKKFMIMANDATVDDFKVFPTESAIKWNRIRLATCFS